jgi:hypothetical protein
MLIAFQTSAQYAIGLAFRSLRRALAGGYVVV